jgi:hypothetical protein
MDGPGKDSPTGNTTSFEHRRRPSLHASPVDLPPSGFSRPSAKTPILYHLLGVRLRHARRRTLSWRDSHRVPSFLAARRGGSFAHPTLS